MTHSSLKRFQRGCGSITGELFSIRLPGAAGNTLFSTLDSAVPERSETEAGYYCVQRAC